MGMRGVYRACAAVVLSVTVASAVSAQSFVTGAIAGVVSDSTGGVLRDATVTVTNVDTNVRQSVRTGDDGTFSVLAIPPGRYAVSAEAGGFRRQDLEQPVTVSLDSRVDLGFKLTPAISESVVVNAPATVINRDRPDLAHVILQPFIQTAPSNVRDFASLALTTPGVASDRTPSQGSSATSGLTFLGQRARSNNIVVDGFDNNDGTVGGFRSVISQDAVAEFEVLAGSYSAEFGKASGGVINVITRSGRNRSDGSAFFFLRDETLNAKEHFERFDPSGRAIQQDKAPYSQKQFGATIGGPLRRDHAFYFAAFERLDIQANNFVTINNSDPVSLFGRSLGTTADILRRAGFPVESGHVPYVARENTLFARIDHNLRPDQALDVRINWATTRNENSEPWGGQVARSRGGVLTATDVMVGGSYRLTRGARFIQEFRSQIAYRDQKVLALDPTCAGPCDRDDEGGPTVEIGGVASLGRQRFSPQLRETLRVQALDTATLEHAGGLLKVGADYSAIDHRSGSLPLHFGGRFIFSPLPAIPSLLPEPVSAIQAFALGLPAAYVQGYGNPESAYFVHDLSAFAQEKWQPTQHLTIDAGARYQRQIWPDISYTVPGLSPYTFPSTGSVAPRLGAAWTPFAQRSITVHGFYGRFYDNHLTSLPGVADVVDGTSSGVRTLVLRFPASVGAWNAPGHRLPEAAVGSYPSLVIAIDPKLRTPYAEHLSAGVKSQIGPLIELSADVIRARGHDQVGTLDYNPLLPELGPDRRPGDLVRNGVPVAGTSASVLQYTSYGQTWYRGLVVSLLRRFDGRSQWLASYTLSKAEDNSTDYQNAFLPEHTGKGRDASNPTGLPIAFDPLRDRSPSLQDQRHRFVGSGTYMLPGAMQVSTIITVGSGRPYNILAGVDLNGDGNGGAFPPDRARRVPSDPASSVTRNSGTLPMYATVDVRVSRTFKRGQWSGEALLEAFNLLNRTNFTEINSVFGPGAYPANPLPTFGQFEKAAPPFQAQIGFRLRR